jgi:hypothetical protein
MSSVRTGLKGMSTGCLFLITGVVGLIILVAGVWYFGVATSGIKGAGDQKKQVNSARNRTDEYNHFFDEKADFDSQVKAAKLARQALAEFEKTYKPGQTPDPTGQLAETDANDHTDVTGAEQECTDTANAYNNDSQKTLTGASFKASGLPASLDPNKCEGK